MAMASITRGRGGTIVKYTESDATSMREQLQQIIASTRVNVGRADSEANFLKLTSASQRIIAAFSRNTHPNHLKDAFRHLEGFRILLDSFKVVWGKLGSSENAGDQETSLEAIDALLMLLGEALYDHWGNQRYFRMRVDGGGWKSIRQVCSSPVALQPVDFSDLLAGLVKSLFACAFHKPSGSRPEAKDGDLDGEHIDRNASQGGVASRHPDRIDPNQDKRVLHNPEALLIVFDYWKRYRDLPISAANGGHADIVRVPNEINGICRLSVRNAQALLQAGLLRYIIRDLAESSLDASSRAELMGAAKSLLKLGVADSQEGSYLYKRALDSECIAELIRNNLHECSDPPYVHFDLSISGSASLELPNLGRSFPPSGASPGYTLSFWLRFIAFDPNAHVTVFGAFDSTQTCFVLVYLEKDTQNLILQTSVSSSRPSVRFKTTRFDAGRWYHLCIVHKRPRTTASSRASLFVDGEFVEQVKATYPTPPPNSIYPNELSAGSTSAPSQGKGVQVFIGTPQDLASSPEEGPAILEWQLASTMLFDETLSDDLIAVYFQLGPRYTGNYQDCLGSFQTYQASAALNLRNETLHLGKEDKSDIMTAVRAKAAVLMPEAKILLNISPNTILNDEVGAGPDQAQLVKSLSRSALKTLRNVTRGGRTSILINGALPSINDALSHNSGVIICSGNPTVVVPQSLDDAVWRVGGCAPVGLSLLEAADKPETVIRSLDILFGTIQHSWRNSEAMERDNGFGVLATLLTFKLERMALHGDKELSDPQYEDFALEILRRILQFVGYNAENPEDSIINNPLAYRVLLVDLDVWRTKPARIQKLYYEQFCIFAAGSKHRHFNSKRLARMRIVKKWIEALKSEVFYEDSFDFFLEALKSVIGGALSAETLRAFALHITYATHKAKPSTVNVLRSTRSLRRAQQPSGVPGRRSTVTASTSTTRVDRGRREISRTQIGLGVLQLYSDLLCSGDVANVKKFARTVTSKWLLNLLADDDVRVVQLTTTILARVLIINGPPYVEKFTEKGGGFVIMKHRLRRWWQYTDLWKSCFAILFGQDVAKIDLSSPFTVFTLLQAFAPDEVSSIVYPAAFQVIIAMLEAGLRSVTSNQNHPASPLRSEKNGAQPPLPALDTLRLHQQNSVSTPSTPQASKPGDSGQIDDTVSPVARNRSPGVTPLEDGKKTLQTVTQFLSDLHAKCTAFRDFTVSNTYVQDLLFLLFPIIVSTDTVSPETELHARDSTLNFNGSDVLIQSSSEASIRGTPIVRTSSIDPDGSPQTSKPQLLNRRSSYILVTQDEPKYHPSTAKLQSPGSTAVQVRIETPPSNSIVQEVLEMIIAVFSDQILSRKDFQGIGLFMKVPPGFQEHQVYFESFILRNTISSLSNVTQFNRKMLWEPRVLTNLARFATHLSEALYEGWFIDGADCVIDFLCGIIEYLQRPDIAQLKSVRLCSEIISAMRIIICRVVILRLSDLDDTQFQSKVVPFLKKLIYWQMVLFAADSLQEDFLKLFCYLLYSKLISANEAIRGAATDLWRVVLVQRLDETSGVLNRMKGFHKVLEMDNESFIYWVDESREELDYLFFGKMGVLWEKFVVDENKRTEDGSSTRLIKRREKLKIWHADEKYKEEVIRHHEISSGQWRANIYASEHSKCQRGVQDELDTWNFNLATWQTMRSQIHRAYGLFDDKQSHKWQLDQTEGKNRMRLRVIPEKASDLGVPQAKGRTAQAPRPHRSTLQALQISTNNGQSPSITSPTGVSTPISRARSPNATEEASGSLEDDFEIVNEPTQDGDEYEDKNRKVQRSLRRGDQVEHVHNISRIVGLEAIEGLLILGRTALYLIDNYFQRSDKEIVNVWQAPRIERDSYMQMISGHQSEDQSSKTRTQGHETRSWRWEDILSISKRRFLFRDVAIEVFFVDGRSYLLTVASPALRDELYPRMLAKAPSFASNTTTDNPEDAWRMEALKSPEDAPQGFGYKFSSVFAMNNANPTTKKWIKGEISNFHYLMLVNTMAGRTFNDLTQYPVFPWVIADYTSEELDLTDPRTFRDLSKPMGCQTLEREAEFKERYQSFAEMGDQSAPAFHYGTHYSSAMIVTSYMIRLPPFVQSYLLLQGGNFDHPDRLFYSIEQAWNSASRDNMTDVRELIPEFFCLPEFLINTNGYDFGIRQGSGGRVENVVLPPWAKGDPKIFIAKNREALESEYVSQYLHQWIDLVFGHKQRGGAALEATNVFHHLSYRGARNLDEILDPVERLATIGIIHNFGQTPHQVFQRPHPQHEEERHRSKKLDTLADTLTRLPTPLLDSEDRISSIVFSQKHERLLCSNPFRIHIPPRYDKYMEWGFIDGSVRFFQSDSKRLVGLFEHMHQGQLSVVLFADSQTLITAGNDCTVSTWTVTTGSKIVEIMPRASFFGHRTIVTALAVSKSFSTLLSASSDGQILLWDLNRSELIRAIEAGSAIECARINDVTGTIILCRGSNVALFTINGALLIEQHVCVEGDDAIVSCSCYEGTGTDYPRRELIFTGHKRGVVNIWSLAIRDGQYVLDHVKRLNHMDQAGFNIGAAITAVLPMPNVVYTGDDDGRVYEWDCIERQ
ncbi:hypothetical protein MMC25_001602 [Agyrium rufum]|nr:hypothetical protein [Agyrium rufum]